MSTPNNPETAKKADAANAHGQGGRQSDAARRAVAQPIEDARNRRPPVNIPTRRQGAGK